MVQNDASLTALLHAGYRYASTLASNPHEAEDLVHESWVRITGQMISNAEDRQLQSALATLRVREREALFLSVIEGYTAQEIAELTLSSRGTILSLIHRARQKLNQRLTAAHTNVVRLVTPQGKN